MIGTDYARYYQPILTQNTAPTPEAPKAGPTPGADIENSTEEVKAPPLSGFGALLSYKDIRMLAIRKISADDQTAYKDMVAHFVSTPENLKNPQEFLENLSSEGILLLERIQSFPPDANVQVSDLNDEEALNFILPHTQKVDLNNDGLIAGPNGAKGFQFPPPNAPQGVKDAWDDATATMSEKDVMLLSGKFMSLLISSNIHVDENGKVTFTEPDDPDWQNPFDDPGFSYQDSVKNFLEGNELSKNFNSPEIYERIKTLLTMLGDTFDEHKVA